MFFQALSKILIIFVLADLSIGAIAYASGGEAAKKEEATAPKEEGSAEGEVSKAQKKQMNEAIELQGKVQALQAKVKAKEDTINKLIEEKNHTKDPEKVKEIIAEMVSAHKEMSKMIEEYEQNRSLLRYRYPEKSYSGSRSYERMEVKPLEQMETQMNVEAKIMRNLKTVRSQYGQPQEDANSKKKSRRKKGTEAPSLTEPIVLQK